MKLLDGIEEKLRAGTECRLLSEDEGNWLKFLAAMDRNGYVPVQYKPGFLRYQETYFKDVYEEYRDVSLVLYRGGRPAGIWPLSAYAQDGKIRFRTGDSPAVLGPLFPFLPKAEGQRAVIESCMQAVFSLPETDELECAETVTEPGTGPWIRKAMEHGGTVSKTIWEAFADLNLTPEEIQARIRRTNKYSVAKGQSEYDIEVHDEHSPDLDKAFSEFHRMHREVAGRETRSQATWDAQKAIIRENSAETGRSFLIFIRDKASGQLAGSALFDATPQTGFYCVAAYDRSRFAKPVGHIVQAVAMEEFRRDGIRWYEVGERAYPGDPGSYDKWVDIGHYKEGFATHLFPKVFVKVTKENFFQHVLK